MKCIINETLLSNGEIVVSNKDIVGDYNESTINFNENNNDVCLENDNETFSFSCHNSEYSYYIAYDYKTKKASAGTKLSIMNDYVKIPVLEFDLNYSDYKIELIYKLESNDAINKLILDIKKSV